MATFKKDPTKVQSFSAGPIKHTGFYPCTITKCYDKKSQSHGSESAAIHFDVVTDNGQYGSFDLWWKGKNGNSTDKNGKDLPALQSINDLQILLELDELNSKPGKVMIYDFDLRQEVETKKMVYADVLNKRIGIIFESSLQPKRQFVGGEWIDTSEMKNVIEFRQFFDADTKASSSEYLSGNDPIACDRFLASLTGHVTKQPIAEKTETKETVIDDYEDDIPFN